MSIRYGYQRKVLFDTKEELGDKMDKLAVMIGKLATRDNGTNRQFKSQIHQSRGRGQNRNYREIIRTDTDQRTGQKAETEDNIDKTEVDLDINKILGEVILEETLGIIVEKSVEENIEAAIEMTVITEAGTGLEKGCFPEIMAIIELEVQATVDLGEDPELAQTGIEFNAISVGNMIILHGTFPLLGKKRKLNSSNRY